MIIKRVLFISVLFTILSIHNTIYLIPLTLVLWTVSYKQWYTLNKRVIKSFLLFNLTISVGWIIYAMILDRSFWDYLIYINLKVYTMTLFIFWFFLHTNIVSFFAFNKELGWLLSITLSQIVSYKKSFEDFRLSWKSRVVSPIYTREYHFIGRVFGYFYNKSLNDSKERSLALKARGVFD